MPTAWRPEAVSGPRAASRPPLGLHLTPCLPRCLLHGRPPHVLQPSCAPALQISLDTRDILIEATATDLTKAHVVVSTLCAMFGEYCSTPYEVEPVEVVSPDGQVTGAGGAQGALRRSHSDN